MILGWVFCSTLSFSQKTQKAGQIPRLSDLVERTEVRFLLVEVTVIDKQGNPVPGLGRENFRLYLDNREASIDSFENRTGPGPVTIGLSDEANQVTSVPAGKTGNKVSLFFDARNSKVLQQQQAREKVLDFLENFVFPTDEVMVISYSDRLRVVQPLTSEKEKWLQAVRRLVQERPDLDPYMNWENVRLDRIYEDCQRRKASGDETYCASAWLKANNFAEEEKTRSVQTLEALKEVILAMGGLPGRKSIFFFSEGIRQVPGEEYLTAAQCGACDVSIFRVPIWTFRLDEEIDDLYRDANASNVTLNTIDTRLSRTLNQRPSGWEPGDPVPDLDARYEFLANLAFQTGGMVGPPSRSLVENLKLLGDRMTTYYILGHSLTDSGPDGGTHNIRVAVNRSGLQLQYRKTFRDLGWKEKEERSVLGAVTVPEIYRNLRVKARVLPVRKDKKRMEAVLEIGLPFSELAWIPTHVGELAEMEFVGIVRDRYGNIQYQFRDPVELKKRGNSPAHLKQGVYYRGRVELKPGSYELSTIVHDIGGGKIGGIRIPFEIPKITKGKFYLSGLGLGKISRGDVVIGRESMIPKKGVFSKKYWTERVVPLLLEDLSSKDILVIYMQIYDPDTGKSNARPELMIQLNYFRDGRSYAAQKPVKMMPQDENSEGSMALAMLTPLRDFEPGLYSIQVEIEKKGSARKVMGEAAFRVH